MTRLWQGLVWVAALLLWQGAASSGLAPATVLPSPLDVWAAAVDLIPSLDYWEAVGNTLMNALRGIVLSALIAIPLGLISASSRFVSDALSLVVDVARSFPSIALLPMLLLMFGATPTTSLVIITISCAFPLYIQTLDGGRDIPASVREANDAFRIPVLTFIRRVSLPIALPAVMTGLRLGATTAVLIAIGCEVLGGIEGIGKQLSMSQQFGAAGRTYVYILTAALLGLGVSWAMIKLEKRFLRWRD